MRSDNGDRGKTTENGRKGGAIQDQEEQKPETPKLKPIRKPMNVTAIAVMGLFILALFYTFYLAREFFLPVVLAWVLSLILKPVVRVLNKAGLPNGIGAAVILIGALLIVIIAVIWLSDPTARWIQEVPQQYEKIEGKIRTLTRPAQKISKAAEKVEELTAPSTEKTPKVELKKSGLLDQVWLQTKSVVYLFAEVFILLFFFLAAGDVFLLKLIQVLPRLKDKKRAVEIARDTAQGVSQYLLGMTMVNLYEGIVIGLGLWWLGLPNPVLWGLLAMLANYIPYIGALVAGSIITFVAIVSFDSLSKALIAPAIYFGVNFSDNFLSPYILGKRLVLNPLIVFLAVMFWGWLWGIVGVLLAVPITVTVKVFCDHIPSLAPFGEFLSSPEEKETPKEEVPAPS
jgi:predicted PurR-regulated permease PerM